MTLPLDTTRAVRSRGEQVALIEAVLNAPASEHETNWLEWKGPVDLQSKPAKATIARAVLGFANRLPDVAARQAEGTAYVLVGVEPGQLHGVEAVDPAVLEPTVVAYCGDGPRWSATYVQVNDRDVLVVTVESPQWGDPPHPVRKAFQSDERGGPKLASGDLLVRRKGATERANAAEVDALVRRAMRVPGDELTVDVELAEDVELVRLDLSPESMERYVREQTSHLLAPLARLSSLSVSALPVSATLRESRSPESFQREVNEYAERLRAELPEALRARGLLHDVARLQLEVINNTDQMFAGVQIELLVPPGVEVAELRPDAAELTPLPEPPAAYGTRAIGAGLHHHFPRSVGPVVHPLPRVRPLWTPTATRTANGTQVVFAEENVRADSRMALPAVWLTLDQGASAALELRWEATGASARGRLRGSLTVPVAERLWTPEELLARVEGGDEEG